MFSLFKKSKFSVVSPAKGMLKSITEVKDEVFSSKALGDGFAVEPEIGEVYSPVEGVIEAAFPTKHAVGIKCNNGIEVLIHIGVDTVELNGDGFESFVSVGQKVKVDDLLVKFDIETIKNKVPSTDIIVVFTSGEGCELIKDGEKVDSVQADIVNIKPKE